jgi:hypothetical protein
MMWQRPNGQMHFTLRTILMWTIHDFLAYGLVAGCVHQGYKTCIICGPYLIAHHLWNWVSDALPSSL